MLFLTIINALPLKKRMKNAFLDNHIFTEYNRSMHEDNIVERYILKNITLTSFTSHPFLGGLPRLDVFITLFPGNGSGGGA